MVKSYYKLDEMCFKNKLYTIYNIEDAYYKRYALQYNKTLPLRGCCKRLGNMIYYSDIKKTHKSVIKITRGPNPIHIKAHQRSKVKYDRPTNKMFELLVFIRSGFNLMFLGHVFRICLCISFLRFTANTDTWRMLRIKQQCG